MAEINNLEFSGKCAFALSLGKNDVDGGRSKLVLGSNVYSFSNPIAKILFQFLPGREKRIQKAKICWESQQ
jgi:hypothetical protein